MDKSKVLFISNHHRRSPYFEESCRFIDAAGFHNLYIQNTGSGEFMHYMGPASKYNNVGAVPYDTGMVYFKQRVSSLFPLAEVIVLIDNDLFFTGAKHLEKRIEDFIASGLDFASYFVNKENYDKYKKINDTYYEVTDQQLLPSDQFPGFVPEPHWENALLLIKRSMWDRLTEDDLSHGRKWIAALKRENAKMGAHHVYHRGTHSHYADDFFHVGALMQFHHYIEHSDLSKINTESNFDMARIGYMWSVQSKFQCLPMNYVIALNRLGHKEKAETSWFKLIEDTPMEDYCRR